ncbi:redoxin domain-containing protein [Bythopirellula polymerisocia]|uniref:Thiol-disulfide oxidoreductase ResA n=1 Tax=Bythopirellula polymerisocia TaxID=2528003 RepID=A0A5C6D082_9BACT|nr:redoxin domain-containing protein [Bythopirellula polymerisocia]TWU29234.1 Thiol-disulfide oxidoreductase ResA [Bythopirellula polymerisocia]
MTLRTCWSILLASMIILPFAGCNSQQKSLNADSATSPEQLIEYVEASLQEMQAYSFNLDVQLDVTAQGVEQNMDSKYDIKIEKPNRWAIVLESGTMGGSSVSDGQNLTLFSKMLQRYAVEPLDESALAMDMQRGSNQNAMLLGAGTFVGLFMGDDLKDWLLDGVSESDFVGEEVIDGATCRIASFQQENGMHWKIAVETGPIPFVRQFVLKPDFLKTAVSQAGMPEGMELTLKLRFDNWNTDAQFGDEVFVFTSPEGAKKVDSMFSQLGGEPELHPLVGEQAPSFSATDLESQTVQLDQFAGQDVVILDFWATWCGPCVDALPIISRVANEFKDKQVVFYAVNQGETADTIREFLSSEDLDVPVLLDQEGAVGSMFQVSGIPQTVIIDKTGRIQVVHVGFGGNLEKQLTKELEDILAGKDLAAAALGEQEP